MLNTLVIKDGGTTVLTALNKDFTEDSILLKELVGWDDFVNASISTEKKLIGNGDYIISKEIGSRTLTISLNIPKNPKNTLDTLTEKYLSFKPLTFELSTLKNGVARKETLTGYIQGIVEYSVYYNWADLTFDVLCPNPTIAVL